MKFWQVFFAAVLVMLLQGAFGNLITLWGVVPDLSLVVVVAVAILFGARRGAATGLALGLLQDLLFGRVIGLYALGKLTVGYAVGASSNNFFKDNLAVPLVLTAAATAAYESYIFLVLGLLFSCWGIGFIPFLLKICLLNSAAAVIVYSLFLRRAD